MAVNGEGPAPARVMIVGEAPGADETRLGRPFVGAAGMELDRMLMEVGLSRSECFVTNVVREQPLHNDIAQFIPLAKRSVTPDCVPLRWRMVKPVVRAGYETLMKEIALVRPNVIVALGNVPLWALTGVNTPHSGIGEWRGSELRLRDEAGSPILEHEDPPPKVIPTYHPAAILRQWEWRAAALRDLRRVGENADSRVYPTEDWRFLVRPSFDEAKGALNGLLERLNVADRSVDLAFDIETRAGHIACAGLAWSPRDALCIPFMSTDRRDGYWPEAEEAELVWLLAQILCHPRARIVGQNLLYEAQYTLRHWGFAAPRVWDTMIAHHVAFPGLPKALEFQASVYCERYVYWKGKEAYRSGDEALWRLNCEDCARTYEIAEALR